MAADGPAIGCCWPGEDASADHPIRGWIKRPAPAPGVLVVLALAMLLAGCAAGPPPPFSAMSAAPIDTVEASVAAALERDGAKVERTAEGLRATSDSVRFTSCVPVLVGGSGGSGSSRKMIRVDQRSATALVRFAPSDGGTRADWSTSYSGRYHNSIRNDSFTRACDGTGALEALLATAVAG